MTGSSRTPAWGPSEIADRCEALGARVTITKNQYRIYPPNGGRPVFFESSRHSRGTHLANVLRDLRVGGLDLVGAWEQEQRTQRPPSPQRLERPAIDPATAARLEAMVSEPLIPTTKETPVTTPKDIPGQPVRIPFDARHEMAELRDMVRKQEDNFLEMLTGYERRVEQLEAEVAELRAGLGGRTRPPSITEVTRGLVLTFFREHPGMKMTPLMVDANLADQLPQGRGPATVAGACRDLATTGRLQGGGARRGGGANHGLYWYDPQADGAAEKAETDS